MMTKQITDVQAIDDIGMTGDDTLAEAGRKIVRYHAQSLYKLVSEDESPALKSKTVHELRVATRSMRSTLRAFKSYYKPRRIQPVVEGLRTLADAASKTRELDVLLADAREFQATVNTRQQASLQALLDMWRDERKQARKTLVRHLRGRAFSHLLSELSNFLGDETAYACEVRTGQPSLVRHAAPLILWQHLARVRSFDTLPDVPAMTDLHALRVAIKQLRYTAEALQAMLPPNLTGGLAQVCTNAQTAYGNINDAHIAALRATLFIKTEAKGKPAGAFTGIRAYIKACDLRVKDGLSQWRVQLLPLLTHRVQA